jgi:hypothetical protein
MLLMRFAPALASTFGLAWTVIVLGLSWSTAALALEPVDDDIRHANSLVAASGGVRRLSYAEYNNGLAPGLPDTLDSENGWLGAFVFEARAQAPGPRLQNAYARASIGYAWGNVEYDGRYQPLAPGGPTPLTATSSAGILDVSADLGLGVPLRPGVALTPLVGYHLRNWNRTLPSAPGQSAALAETYTHHEFAVGALLQLVLTRGLVAGVEATVGPTIAPSVSFQPSTTSESLAVDLGSTPVVRGAASLDYAVGSVLHVLLEYDFCTFGYGRSSVVPLGNGLGLTEPDSRTFEHQLRAAVAVGFGP